MYLSIIFIIFVLIGTYLNKIVLNGQDIVLDSINDLNNYYSQGSNINVRAVVFSNLRENIFFLGSIVIFTLFVFTFPLAIISFLLKGVSIGYTINSFILLIKLKSIKMILISLIGQLSLSLLIQLEAKALQRLIILMNLIMQT